MRLPTRRFLVLSALLLALGAVVAPSAMAVNEIAYRCDLDICLMDPANPGAVQNLTANGGTSYDGKPIWSPDGTKVAFVSDFFKGGHGEKNVFVMPVSGDFNLTNIATQITPYTSGAKEIDDLAWSPDGSRIAYTRGNNAGDDKIWVVNADGTTTFPLEIGGGGAKRHPSWSPDSSRIAYAVVKNEPEQIYLASSLGGFGQPLANGVGHEPNWSPDGSRIAFDGYRSGGFGYIDLHVVSADGSGIPLIVTPSLQTEWTFNAWSPDASRIAYRATVSNEQTLYRVMNANGAADHPVASPGDGDARSASWSPDGSRLVYEGALIGNIGARNLYLANADGSGVAQPLTSDGKSFDPAWRVVTAAPPGQPPAPGQHTQLPPPHPGAEKPKLVWITNRAPITGNGPVHVMIVFCGAPDCGAHATGTSKASRAAGVRFRVAQISKKKPKKPKAITVGAGDLKLHEGESKTLEMYLNKKGQALLKKKGKLDIQATVTITSTGLPTETSKKTIHVVAAKPKKGKKGKH